MLSNPNKTLKLIISKEDFLFEIHFLYDRHFRQRGGQAFFYAGGKGQTFSMHSGGQIFFMIMIIIENVSEANILSSEARKPPAGARIYGPVGP